MESYRELLDRLAHIHPTLAPQVRKAAAYTLENPGAIGTLSMRKVAADAKVPPPTLPRLAQAMGYQTYDAFKEVFRTHLQDKTVGYAEQAGQLQQLANGDDTASLLSALKQASVQNVEHLFATLDHAVIENVADILISARTVYVVGMQASFAPAVYLQYVGAMAHKNWVLLDSRNGDIAVQTVQMNEQDVLVAIAVPPSARESIMMAEFAREKGAKVIGITSSRVSTLAARSDHILVVPMQSPQFFESYVAIVLLLEILLGFVVAKGGEEVVKRIESVERCRHRLGEYWEQA